MSLGVNLFEDLFEHDVFVLLLSLEQRKVVLIPVLVSALHLVGDLLEYCAKFLVEKNRKDWKRL